MLFRSGLRSACDEVGAFCFPRRYITRPADAGSEDHCAIDVATFDKMASESEFLFRWTAHGLKYGVGMDALVALRQGRNVVINVSRAIIAQVRRDFHRRLILLITASDGTLRRRLETRSRDSDGDIEQRIARAHTISVHGPDVVQIANDGDLQDAVQAARNAIDEFPSAGPA